jgi:chromosome segregation ATPase
MNLEAHIRSVNAKLQLLLKNHAALQKENESLKQNITSLRTKEKEYSATIDTLQQKLNVLQVAAGNMPEADKKDFEKRINQYIKDIDKCISTLSE